MFPGTFVAGTPDKPAVIRPATGEQLTYRQLDERSLRLARYLRAIGMRPGDHLAVVAGNDLRVLEVYWAALRSGLYITAVNWHLTPAEAAYVVDDCEASALVVSVDAAAALPADPTELPKVRCRLVFGERSTATTTTKRCSRSSRTNRWNPSRAGRTCCTRRAPPAGPKGSNRSCPRGRYTRPSTPTPRCSRRCTASTPTPSTCARHRCITLRHCASAARSTPSAGP